MWLHRDIRACQKYADACARIAARTADAKSRDDFLRLQHCWLRLGRSLEFAARLPGVHNQHEVHRQPAGTLFR